MPLPNLSGKSFISTSPTLDSFQSGADSYREKVKEKIQNSPRRNTNFDYTRSIDLSLNRENTFLPISRNRDNNTANRLKTAVSDNNYSRLKSSRSRQIVFYNNNGETAENESNTVDLKKELHRRNNTRSRNFNASPLLSDDDFTINTERNDKQRGTNDFFDTKATPMARDSLLKAPLITPRKSVQHKIYDQDINEKKQNRNNSYENDNEFVSKSVDKNRSKQKSLRNYESSRTSFSDDNNNTPISPPPPPPIPVPRKRDQTAKIITNNPDDFLIKRNSSASSNKRSGYMPSPRSDQQTMIQNEPNKQYIRFQNDSNAPIIKSNPRDDAKNVGLLNSRKSGLKFRNSNISFESNQEQ